MSPYKTDVFQTIHRFATNERRCEILSGWIEFRNSLLTSGITSGFQWINGSFTSAKPDPRDIDVVTFFYNPFDNPQALHLSLCNQGIDFTDIALTKKKFNVDAYPVDLGIKNPKWLIDNSRYWHGLFTHTRDGLWKGILELPLATPDEYQQCLDLIETIRSNI